MPQLSGILLFIYFVCTSKMLAPAWGKSGGARAITYVYIETETVYLLTIYDKGEKENLKPNELKMMIESLGL